jgi:hypothetical protein
VVSGEITDCKHEGLISQSSFFWVVEPFISDRRIEACPTLPAAMLGLVHSWYLAIQGALQFNQDRKCYKVV